MSRIQTLPNPPSSSSPGNDGAVSGAAPEAKDTTKQSFWQNAVRLSGFMDDPLFIAYSVIRGKKTAELHAARAAGTAPAAVELKGISRFILPAEKLGTLDKVALGICIPLQTIATFEDGKDFWNAHTHHASLGEQARLGIATVLSAGSLLTAAAMPEVSLALYAGSAATYYCKDLAKAASWTLHKTTEVVGALESDAKKTFNWLTQWAHPSHSSAAS